MLGLHFILACGIAAALGTLIGNPVTFPLIFSATCRVGVRIRDLADTVPSQPVDRILEGLDDEAEADAAADAVLYAAEDLLEGGWGLDAIDVLWPVLCTLFVGAVLLVVIAYVVFYFAARIILHSLGRR